MIPPSPGEAAIQFAATTTCGELLTSQDLVEPLTSLHPRSLMEAAAA
jgi:hypothetical protein